MTVVYAVSLLVADALLKRFGIQGPAACAGLVVGLSIGILIVPVVLLHPGGGTFYYLVLILPGAAAGGAVLGRGRAARLAADAAASAKRA